MLSKIYQKDLAKKSTHFLVYFLIGLSIYWGTLLFIFSVYEFFVSMSFSSGIFQLVYASLGIIAWINAIHYIKKLKTTSIESMWQAFYKKFRKRVLFTAVSTTLFLILFFMAQSYRLPAGLNGFLTFIALPAQLGQSIIFTITIHLKRSLSFLVPINNLGWILGVSFQIIGFYYFSTLLFWKKKVTKQPPHSTT